MEKDHKIEWMEEVVKFDKKAYECSNEEDGKFTIYEKDREGVDFPGFADIKPGSVIRGNMYTNDKGYKTLYPPKAPKARAGGPSIAMMEKKEKSIEKFQANKEESIREAGAQRDAVQMVTTFYGNDWANLYSVGKMTETELDARIKAKYEEYRKYFLEETPF